MRSSMAFLRASASGALAAPAAGPGEAEERAGPAAAALLVEAEGEEEETLLAASAAFCAWKRARKEPSLMNAAISAGGSQWCGKRAVTASGLTVGGRSFGALLSCCLGGFLSYHDKAPSRMWCDKVRKDECFSECVEERSESSRGVLSTFRHQRVSIFSIHPIFIHTTSHALNPGTLSCIRIASRARGKKSETAEKEKQEQRAR